MGGYGSGRAGGRPTVNASCKVDLAWMLREGMAAEGLSRSGVIRWNCGGEPAGSISYRADMSEQGDERLILSYVRGPEGESEDVEQVVRLTFTRPHFGGKRWWMICPYRGHRVGKLYKPPGGDRFASRKAWRLGYHSQRISKKDAAFERLFRLQEKLGCERGWGNWITRPKGMHWTTFERYLEEYEYLDQLCGLQMMQVIGLLKSRM